MCPDLAARSSASSVTSAARSIRCRVPSFAVNVACVGLSWSKRLYSSAVTLCFYVPPPQDSPLYVSKLLFSSTSLLNLPSLKFDTVCFQTFVQLCFTISFYLCPPQTCPTLNFNPVCFALTNVSL
uniref:Uncharacterized protein n=1 Tax=Cacopsylla melanoneura TaxID=428564 RepID=A0A8D8YXE8_9HEMI